MQSERRAATRLYKSTAPSFSKLPGAARGAFREDLLDDARKLLDEIVRKRTNKRCKPLAAAHLAAMLTDAGAMRRIAARRIDRSVIDGYARDCAVRALQIEDTVEYLGSMRAAYRMRLRSALENLGAKSSTLLVPGATVSLQPFVIVVCSCHGVDPAACPTALAGEPIVLEQRENGTYLSIAWDTKPNRAAVPLLADHELAPAERPRLVA